jgi:hypothetical protein
MSFVAEFNKCDTKPEVGTVVTNLFVWSGAKKLMTVENVERITTALHTHYSTIFAQLNDGQSKVLSDAAPDAADQAAEAAELAAATAT